MAIFVITNQPRKLLENLKRKINDKKIDTWLYDNDGDFYHVPNQWKFKAWLSPFVENNRLVFGIIGQKEINLSTLAYAVYHGRFVEMLLNHFDQQFSEVNISSQKTQYDRF